MRRTETKTCEIFVREGDLKMQFNWVSTRRGILRIALGALLGANAFMAVSPKQAVASIDYTCSLCLNEGGNLYGCCEHTICDLGDPFAWCCLDDSQCSIHQG